MFLKSRILVALTLAVASVAHSGVYSVNITKVAKDFSASWLISRSRFIKSQEPISHAVSMASATFSTIRNNCENCTTLATRDFMDFMVEHLSSATNQLPSTDRDIMAYTISRIEQTADLLKQSAKIEKDPRLDETLGILVYSSICFSKVTESVQSTVRPAFFKATFWSMYRYVKNIVVYVANLKDKEIVEDMKLPYVMLTQLLTPLDSKNRTSLLPRDSILDVLNSMKLNDPFYKQYNYVFFSEGDQIVHLREPEVLFDTIDNSGGSFLVVPHRMQSLTLAQDFPEEQRFKWSNDHAQNIPGMPVVMGDIDGLQGSCCQNGDVDVAPCFGWWYQCTTYGIRDFPQWLKFGEYGLTMPPVTEHKATCEYFPDRRQCPLPASCSSAVPRIATGKSVLTPDELCTEIVQTRYLGYGRSDYKVRSAEISSVVVKGRDRSKPLTMPEPVMTTASTVTKQNLRHEQTQSASAIPSANRVGTSNSKIDNSSTGSTRKSIKMRRKNRTRRRNRRIESLTIANNEKRAGGVGNDKKTAGLKIVSMDDIQIS